MRTIPALAAAALLAPAASALADKRVVTAPPNRFVTPEVSILQGERLTLLNQDVSSHDVVARIKGPDGKPLFASRLARTGEEVPVEGVAALPGGEYEFLCSIHPSMTGKLTVVPTSASEPPPPPSGDERPPLIELSVVDTKVARVVSQRRVRIRLSSDENGDATVAVALHTGGRRYALGPKAVSVTAGQPRTAKLWVPRRARRALTRTGRGTVRVAIMVTDGAGNASRATSEGMLD